MYTGSLLKGRQVIYTDETEITERNIVAVLTQAIMDHELVRGEIERLYRYEAGDQPIFYRVKNVRPEINIHANANYAKEIVDFKLGFEYGSPYTFVQRAKDDISKADPQQDDKRIAILNEMLYEQGKPAKDLECERDFKICGLGYMCALPKKYDDGGKAPFDLLVLNPRNTFIIITNDAYRRPIMAVTYAVTRDGVKKITAYTADSIYQGGIWQEKERDEEGVETLRWSNSSFIRTPNPIGLIPIVEFECSKGRQGAFEPEIPLMDALNIVNSDRVNDVAQYVQSILWLNNCKIDETQKAELVNGGMITTKSTADGREARIEYVSAPLNQSQTQALVDYMYEQILEIAGVPGRDSAAGGTTGNAILLARGWQLAETQAKASIMLSDQSQMELLKVILAIFKNTPGLEPELKELTLSDVLPHIGRNKTYELSSRVNAMVTMLKSGIDVEKAITVVDIFDDPQQVTIDSMGRINQLLFGTPEEDMGEEVAPEDTDAELQRLAENAWDNYGPAEDRDVMG